MQAYKRLPQVTTATWLEERGESPPERQRRSARHFFAMLRGFRSGFQYFNEQTYAGAPGGASAELGERFLDTLGEHAATACTQLLDGEISPRDCHSPIWKLRFLFLNPLAIRLSNLALGFRNPIA